MAFPAVPRNAKSYDIENAINRILRWLNPGFGADNAGKVLASNSNGTDLEWADIPYPTLTKLTAALAADVALNNTSNWFDGPSVAQGATGTWLVGGQILLKDTAGAAHIQARLWDGTTTYAFGQQRTNDSVTLTTISLSAIVASPAGNLRLAAKDLTSTSGVIIANGSTLECDSEIWVVRIG